MKKYKRHLSIALLVILIIATGGLCILGIIKGFLGKRKIKKPKQISDRSETDKERRKENYEKSESSEITRKIARKTSLEEPEQTAELPPILLNDQQIKMYTKERLAMLFQRHAKKKAEKEERERQRALRKARKEEKLAAKPKKPTTLALNLRPSTSKETSFTPEDSDGDVEVHSLIHDAAMISSSRNVSFGDELPYGIPICTPDEEDPSGSEGDTFDETYEDLDTADEEGPAYEEPGNVDAVLLNTTVKINSNVFSELVQEDFKVVDFTEEKSILKNLTDLSTTLKFGDEHFTRLDFSSFFRVKGFLSQNYKKNLIYQPTDETSETADEVFDFSVPGSVYDAQTLLLRLIDEVCNEREFKQIDDQKIALLRKDFTSRLNELGLDLTSTINPPERGPGNKFNVNLSNDQMSAKIFARFLTEIDKPEADRTNPTEKLVYQMMNHVVATRIKCDSLNMSILEASGETKHVLNNLIKRKLKKMTALCDMWKKMIGVKNEDSYDLVMKNHYAPFLNTFLPGVNGSLFRFLMRKPGPVAKKQAVFISESLREDLADDLKFKSDIFGFYVYKVPHVIRGLHDKLKTDSETHAVSSQVIRSPTGGTARFVFSAGGLGTLPLSPTEDAPSPMFSTQHTKFGEPEEEQGSLEPQSVEQQEETYSGRKTLLEIMAAVIEIDARHLGREAMALDNRISLGSYVVNVMPSLFEYYLFGEDVFTHRANLSKLNHRSNFSTEEEFNSNKEQLEMFDRRYSPFGTEMYNKGVLFFKNLIDYTANLESDEHLFKYVSMDVYKRLYTYCKLDFGVLSTAELLKLMVERTKCNLLSVLRFRVVLEAQAFFGYHSIYEKASDVSLFGKHSVSEIKKNMERKQKLVLEMREKIEICVHKSTFLYNLLRNTKVPETTEGFGGVSSVVSSPVDEPEERGVSSEERDALENIKKSLTIEHDEINRIIRETGLLMENLQKMIMYVEVPQKAAGSGLQE